MQLGSNIQMQLRNGATSPRLNQKGEDQLLRPRRSGRAETALGACHANSGCQNHTGQQCLGALHEFKLSKAPNMGGWITENLHVAPPHSLMGRMANATACVKGARVARSQIAWCALKRATGGRRPILISTVWLKKASAGSSSRRKASR